MPNLRTQGQLEDDLEKFQAQEHLLRTLGWFETAGMWYAPSGQEYTFKQACDQAGVK